MSKIKGHLHDWLENYGFDLGFDFSNAPNFEDLNWVADDRIDADTYWSNYKKGLSNG